MLLPVLMLLSAAGTWSSQQWNSVQPVYRKITAHPFLRGLQDGSLERAKFQMYLQQDALYLRSFSEALKVVAAKAPRAGWRATLEQHAKDAIAEEAAMHRSILASYGAPEAKTMTPTNRAYTQHLIDTSKQSFGEGLAALLPCYWIYLDVGKLLQQHGSKNPDYQRWIDNYADPAYAASVQAVLGMMDDTAPAMKPEQKRRAAQNFARSAQFEYDFWDMAWRLESPHP